MTCTERPPLGENLQPLFWCPTCGTTAKARHKGGHTIRGTRRQCKTEMAGVYSLYEHLLAAEESLAQCQDKLSELASALEQAQSAERDRAVELAAAEEKKETLREKARVWVQEAGFLNREVRALRAYRGDMGIALRVLDRLVPARKDDFDESE